MRVGLIGAEIEENLAMRCIAASLQAAGHETRIFDFHERAQIAEVVAAVVDWAPGLVGMSLIFTARCDEFMDLAAELRARGFAGHLTAGGHFAALHAAPILEDCPALDSIVHGEGEEPMVDIARDPTTLAGVPGLTIREAGGLRHTGPRPNPEDLDSRPWSLRPEKLHAYLGRPIASLLASRGCWADCAFCSINAFHRQCGGGRRYRQRRIDAVAAEMIHLYRDHGVRIFNFQDDNFLLPSRKANLERYGALRDALAAAGVGRLAMQVKARPDCIDDEVVDLLRSIGLFRFFLGIETDAVTGLRTLGRGVERFQNHRALEIVRQREVHTCFNLLMFDPESSLEAIAQNVAFMRRQSYFPLNFCRVEVYGGTAIEERLRRENRLIGDYRGYTYRIADPQAQRAYEMFRDVFWARNFGPGGMHHESMKVDYNFHVLRHFRPERADRRLERRVKGLVHEVNRDSAAIMERILEFAASPAWDDRQAVDREVAALRARRETADASLGARIRAVVRRIETLAAAPEPARRPLLRAAAAASAALLAALPACRRHADDTHMCEMAPPPYETYAAGGPSLPPREAYELVTQLESLVGGELSSLFDRYQLAHVAIEVGLEVAEGGRIVGCEVAQSVDPAFREELCDALRDREFEGVRSAGVAHVNLRWRPGPEVVEDWRYTHMCEAAPPPYEPYPIEPYELEDVAPPETPLPEAEETLVVSRIVEMIGTHFSSQFTAAELIDVDVPIWIAVDHRGNVHECDVAPLVGADLGRALCSAIEATVFDGVSTGGSSQLGVRWDGSIRPLPPPDTHMCEMAPDDIVPYYDDTHMCEMAPPPYDVIAPDTHMREMAPAPMEGRKDAPDPKDDPDEGQGET